MQPTPTPTHNVQAYIYPRCDQYNTKSTIWEIHLPDSKISCMMPKRLVAFGPASTGAAFVPEITGKEPNNIDYTGMKQKVNNMIVYWITPAFAGEIIELAQTTDKLKKISSNINALAFECLPLQERPPKI